MKTVYKYPFATEMSVPLRAKLLKVAYQEGELFAWFLVDPKEELIKTKYMEIYGTGQPFSNGSAEFYVNTVFDPNGFVWHIFEYYHE